jgi:hypothetical protein
VSAPGEAGVAPAPAQQSGDVAALQAQLDRMAQQLEVVAEESRRARERWEAVDELVRDMTPVVRQMVAGAAGRLEAMQGKGYGEVLGASGEVLDRAVQEFDRESVEKIGDNLLLLLRTIKGM